MKALVISHAHPVFSVGGAETASHALFEALRRRPGWRAHYLAAVSRPLARHPDTPLLNLRRGPDETLYWAEGFDLLNLSNPNRQDYSEHLEPFLAAQGADVAHVHHVLGFGLELLVALRRRLPAAAIVMTLHEYLLICPNDGQMIKRPSGRLCRAGDAVECGRCFPEIGAAAMMRRELAVRRALGLVDAFVGPSRFILDRFVSWGLPRERCVLIENGVAGGPVAPPRGAGAPPARRNRFGFFGQLTPYKGVRLLLDAVRRIPDETWGEDGGLTIHGGALDRQPEAFQREIRALIARAGPRVRFAGAYGREDLPDLMREVDWTVVPSTWWENAPVVIQESFHHGRPVICADIGGMAEKVRDGLDGLHFRHGDAADLARRMTEAMGSPALWERLRRGVRPPPDAAAVADRHAALYEAAARSRVRPESRSPAASLAT